jgi:hypothetical protein
MSPDCAGFGFVYKAVDGRKDKQGGDIISCLHPYRVLPIFVRKCSLRRFQFGTPLLA